MSDEATHQAVTFFDICTTRKHTKKYTQDQIALACTSLAYKYLDAEDTSVPYIKPGHLVQVRCVTRLEMRVLKILEYKLYYPVSYTLLWRALTGDLYSNTIRMFEVVLIHKDKYVGKNKTRIVKAIINHNRNVVVVQDQSLIKKIKEDLF